MRQRFDLRTSTKLCDPETFSISESPLAVFEWGFFFLHNWRFINLTSSRDFLLELQILDEDSTVSCNQNTLLFYVVVSLNNCFSLPYTIWLGQCDSVSDLRIFKTLQTNYDCLVAKKILRCPTFLFFYFFYSANQYYHHRWSLQPPTQWQVYDSFLLHRTEETGSQKIADRPFSIINFGVFSLRSSQRTQFLKLTAANASGEGISLLVIQHFSGIIETTDDALPGMRLD